MRVFDLSFLSSIFLLAVPLTNGADANGANVPMLRSTSRSLQVRTDLIRLIPFEVQIAIQDEMISEEDSQVVSETLYQGGTLLTDTITDWMTASFFTKTSIDQAEALLVNNVTTFDYIALELVDDSTSSGMIDGQEMSLVQVSYQGISLWERLGTGTPPMEADLVELIQRATFLEDRSLKAALQITVDNLLFGLGIESVNGVQPITIFDVRAYITPNGANGAIDSSGDDNDEGGGESESESGEENEDSTNDNDVDTTNKNLETIIIVAIVVACLAFALLIFAVVWAWRSDRQDRDRKPSSSSTSSRKQTKKDKKKKLKSKAEEQRTTEPSMNRNGNGVGGIQIHGQRQSAQKQQVEAEIEPASSYDLPHNNSDGSYPRVIGKNGNYNGGGTDDSAVGFDSVVSEDVSSSLSAYYKSGNIHSESRRASSGGRNFNDAASMSSMDSYGYSLDGYAPSLGPAQGGYPVGPMAAARDAPMPMGDAMDSNADTTDDDATTDEYGFHDVANNDLKQLQDEESVADYDAEVAKA